MALLGGEEAHAGDAEIVDAELLVRAHLARDVDEAPARHVELGEERGFVDLGQHGLEAAHRVGAVHHLPRIGIDGGGRERDREDHAVAIDDHRPSAPGEQDGRAARRILGRRGRRLDRADHGRVGELEAEGGEEAGEARRGAEQAAAARLQRGTAGEVRRGDAHGLEAWDGAEARRAGRAGGRGPGIGAQRQRVGRGRPRGIARGIARGFVARLFAHRCALLNGCRRVGRAGEGSGRRRPMRLRRQARSR